MSAADDFYAKRDRRTEEYLGASTPSGAVHIEIGADEAATAAGQLAVLALLNHAARVHRSITVAPLPDVPIMVTTGFTGARLAEAVEATILAIDPYNQFAFQERPSNVPSVCIGTALGHTCYVGYDRGIAEIGADPVPCNGSAASSLRGAALASCLGAAALFRCRMGHPAPSRRVSVWNFAEGSAADPGPSELPILNVGRGLVLGAGAVTGGLSYWLRAFGVAGSWVIVDRDRVDLPNLNRGMVFTADHAGWPAGVPSAKASLVVEQLGRARALISWYDESTEARNEDFDVVLCLANDRDVRSQIANRAATVVLHATTGANWLSQVHRHVAGVDDCIRCRMADVRDPVFGCSTGPAADVSGKSTDAALPFLSAASGLMLTTLLARLQAGLLVTSSINNWRWLLDFPPRMAAASTWECKSGCRVVPPVETRRRINAETKWVGLDGVQPP